MPVTASIALAAAPGVLQVVQGIRQNKNARRVKYQDLTPAAFNEELAASRLAANNQRLPGQGASIDRINSSYNNSLNNSIQAGTSSVGILSNLGRLNANRNNAFVNLGQQAAQFQQGQQARLSGNLRQQANYQQQSQQAYNTERAALKEAGARNIFGGVSTLAGAGITGLTGGFGMKDNTQQPIDPLETRQTYPQVTGYNPNIPGQIPQYNNFSQYGQRRQGIPSASYYNQ